MVFGLVRHTISYLDLCFNSSGEYMVSIQEWTKNVEEMRKDLILWAYGYNTQEHKSTFWTRNYLNIVFYGLFGLLSLICVIMRWTTPLLIIGFLVGFRLIGELWQKIKKLWN